VELDLADEYPGESVRLLICLHFLPHLHTHSGMKARIGWLRIGGNGAEMGACFIIEGAFALLVVNKIKKYLVFQNTHLEFVKDKNKL
jgi:hypothetical protein